MQIEFVDIDEDNLSQDSEEIQRAIQEFHRQGWEVKGVYIPKRSVMLKGETNPTKLTKGLSQLMNLLWLNIIYFEYLFEFI